MEEALRVSRQGFLLQLLPQSYEKDRLMTSPCVKTGLTKGHTDVLHTANSNPERLNTQNQRTDGKGHLSAALLQVNMRGENSAPWGWHFLGLGLASVDSSLNTRRNQIQRLELVFLQTWSRHPSPVLKTLNHNLHLFQISSTSSDDITLVCG